MALSSDMVDTYRRYKKGTQSFVQWLAQTARSTGTVDKLFIPEKSAGVPRAATGGRLKGKARKEAKDLAVRTPTTIVISVNQFCTLAKAIATSKKITTISPAVFQALRAVIGQRKECAQWYLGNQDQIDSATQDANSQHQYFIEILQEVCSILEPKKQKLRPVAPTTTPKAKKVDTQFAHLAVEDTIKTDDVEIPESLCTPTTKDAVHYQSEISDADDSFALFCLLGDMRALRFFVKETWREFLRGDIALQTAALVTNTACAMLERLNDTFLEDFPRFKQTGEVSMWDKVNHFFNKEADGLGPDTHDGMLKVYQDDG